MMSRKFLITITTLLVIALAGGLAIFFAKGYTFSPSQKRIVGSGIVTVTSEPDAASVFVDGHLTTATNATIASLSPKSYSIKVVKEGFIPWERSVEVKEGLVTDLKVTLFPAIPTIYPLTFTGVSNPVLSPDGSKLAYIVPTSKKAGVWVWTQTRNQPIAFARSAEPHQIAANTTADFSKATLKWSPDSKEVLASLEGNNYLLNADNLNSDPRDITAILTSTIKTWDEDAKLKDEARVASIKLTSLRKVASESAYLRWSPDETKFMARKEAITEPENGKEVALISDMKVYDLEEAKEYLLPPAKAHFWLPDSRHVILVEDNAISLVDFDGTNKAVIYAGTFLNNFVSPWPDSSRLVIVSTFPTPTASEPNFYGVNLR